jgi:ABC-type sugar transport system substrate-binding protein
VGIDDLRVEILAKVITKYGKVELILTSDWKEMKEAAADYQYLLSKLEKYGLHITGKTKDHVSNRGEGINDYLKEHPQIEDFVILDDKTYDFDDDKRLWERLLLTDGIENAKCASKTPQTETMIFLDYIESFS